MAILTDSGRTALATAVKNSVLHLAWGRGQSWWDENRTDVVTFAADERASLGRGYVGGVKVYTPDELTTYVAGTDYAVDLVTGILTRLPGGSIPSKGTVRVAFKTPRPPESPARITLFDEVGRKKVTECRYVIPNAEAGSIVMTTGRFDPSDVPTPHLLVRTVFAFNEAPLETIRETAVVLGTVAKPNVPPGQLYLAPAEIVTPGILLVLQYTSPIVRNGATQQSFESVLTF